MLRICKEEITTKSLKKIVKEKNIIDLCEGTCLINLKSKVHNEFYFYFFTSLFTFLFFYSIGSYGNTIAKSPQEKCVDAHMRLWEATPWLEEGSKNKKYMEKSRNYRKYKSLFQKGYYEFYNKELLNSKKKLRAEYEADSWVRCMRK